MSFLTFEELDQIGKTRRIRVDSKWQPLGVIKWYGPWRRYCFYPQENMLFDLNCLKEITNKIDSLMEERKKLADTNEGTQSS